VDLTGNGAFVQIFGHFVMEAGSSFSADSFVVASRVNDNNEWSLARVTLGSGATMNNLSAALFFGTVEMAAGSHISLSSAEGGLFGWQNLVFDGNGQEGTTAWISTPVIII
jgi:hypothetical protein